jgi:hypothetical protein
VTLIGAGAGDQRRLDEALAGNVPRLFVIEAEPATPGQRKGRTVSDSTPIPLTFGIYPGSAVGDTGVAGRPDRPDRPGQDQI